MDNVIELLPEDLDALQIDNIQTPKIDPRAFYGFLKDFVDIATSNSEASPIAVASNVISLFCATIGRKVFQNIGDAEIHCRPFFLIVGKSSKARKGTSEFLPRRVFARVEEILMGKTSCHEILKIHGGGLSSGEGIAYAIRDPSQEGNTKDPGVPDKRLLVIEPEFANVLVNCKRDKSTLSAVIRNVFDGRTLAPLTKRDRTCATDPQVIILGHITELELRRKISDIEVCNGFLNRFLVCQISRQRYMALPEKTSDDEINRLATKIIDIIDFVNPQTKVAKSIEVRMDENAKQFWEQVYPIITRDIPGTTGALLARSEMYVRMLAMIFALFDQQLIIEIKHFKAAICWIDYVGDSVRYLFQGADENRIETISNDIIKMLQTKNEMTRTDFNKAFSGHLSSTLITEALTHLLNQSPQRIVQSKHKTHGRRRVSYTLAEKAN